MHGGRAQEVLPVSEEILVTDGCWERNCWFSSGIWSTRGYRCSSRRSHTCRHPDSTNRTQWVGVGKDRIAGPQVEFFMVSLPWYLPNMNFLPPCCSTYNLLMVFLFLNKTQSLLWPAEASPQVKSFEKQTPRHRALQESKCTDKGRSESGQEQPLMGQDVKSVKKRQGREDDG